MRYQRHFILNLSEQGDPRRADFRRGQSTIEMAILIMIIVFAFIAMQVYLKRGIQGRLRANIDSIGEQYDPEKTTSEFNLFHDSDVTTTSESTEEMYIDPTSWSGQYQNRVITMVHTQTNYDNTVKTGFEYVGAP
ncbi:MAG: hypothetical protein WC409_06275 [Candidatus Omnitrophota bacterium]|jgi:hypothetical protein